MVTDAKSDEIDAAGVPALAAELFSAARSQPIVGVTTRPHTADTWIDPAALARELHGRARVVVIPTGDTTWELARAIPEKLAVYGGHLRIWWPGLQPDSVVHDHPILWIKGERDARLVYQRILEQVGGRSPLAQVHRGIRAIEECEEYSGIVVKLDPGYALVEFEGRRGLVSSRELVTGMQLEPGVVLRLGQQVRVKLLEIDEERNRFSLSLAQASPPPWERVAELYQVGDIVRGRVAEVHNLWASLELMPGVFANLRVERMGAGVVHPSKLLAPDQLANVEIVAFDPAHEAIELAVPERIDPARYREQESLLPGGPPFPPEPSKSADATLAESRTVEGLRKECRQLELQLGEVARQRDDFNRQLSEQRGSLRELRRELERERTRAEKLEFLALGGDPLESDAAFVNAIRRVHETMYTASDRASHPLREFRLGARFLESVRGLSEVSAGKIVEVCVHVVADRTDAVPGKYVHPLKAGDTGPQRVRSSDGAKAWRCALQVESPQARRLHWWVVRGGGIELASVNLHDDMGIPD